MEVARGKLAVNLSCDLFQPPLRRREVQSSIIDVVTLTVCYYIDFHCDDMQVDSCTGVQAAPHLPIDPGSQHSSTNLSTTQEAFTSHQTHQSPLQSPTHQCPSDDYVDGMDSPPPLPPLPLLFPTAQSVNQVASIPTQLGSGQFCYFFGLFCSALLLSKLTYSATKLNLFCSNSAHFFKLKSTVNTKN